MAEAGFFHSPKDRDPDIARCFVCFKELEGWEPEDNPMYVLCYLFRGAREEMAQW